MHDGITMCDFIQVVKFDYGKQDENPIDKMRFYAKGDPDIAFRLPKEEVYIIGLICVCMTPFSFRFLNCYLTTFKK